MSPSGEAREDDHMLLACQVPEFQWGKVLKGREGHVVIRIGGPNATQSESE